jgi:hypothetical protein
MSYRDRADHMAQRMKEQLRAKGDGLESVARYAGRRLPKSLHRAADTMIEAERLSGHPRLRTMIDERKVTKAEKRLERFLDEQDPGAERMAAFLDRLAGVAFVICVTALGLFFWALWTGHL